MHRTIPLCLASWHRLGKAVGLCAALLLLPSACWAIDPVEKLKDALDPNERLLAQRKELIEKTIPELKSISQLRRAYFLKEWAPHTKLEKVDPKLDIDSYRKTIGKNLMEAIRKAAQEPNVDRQIAVAIMIAEMAAEEQPDARTANGKFASRFTDLLVAGKEGKSLAEHDNLLVRQSALNALGKITPKPADAKPALRAALVGGDLGPRRLAAYALIDLVKNAHFREHVDEMDTISDAVTAAAATLANPEDDELIRAYCLQAIQASARIFTNYAWSNEGVLLIDPLDPEAKKIIMDDSVRKILGALRDTTPRITSTLKKDPNVNMRLTALDALSQIVNARIKLIAKLTDDQKEFPVEKRANRSDLLKAYKAPDPIGKLLDGDWEVVPGLLNKEEDVRLRRGAIAIMEMVAEDVEKALADKKINPDATPAQRRRFIELMTPALYDTDRLVRWTAVRAIRHITFENIDEAIILALGHMLIDPVDRDADLSAAAAATLEDIAASPHAYKAIRFLKSAITDREKDVEIRLAAMKTLTAIGSAGDDIAKKTANAAFPEVTSVLSETDVRLRRAAAETLGMLGEPPTRAIGEEAIAALKSSLRDEDAQVRHNASEAILSIVVPR